MVISIQELRKYERQRQLEQMQMASSAGKLRPGKFPWQKGALGQPVPEAEPHGALKLARLLYGE